MRAHFTNLILILAFILTSAFVATGCAGTSHVPDEPPHEQLMSFHEADTVYADQVVTEYVFAGDELVLDAPASDYEPAI